MVIVLLVEELHRIGFGRVGNVNIRLHGLVVAVASPLHHDLWGYSQHESVADERTPPCVCAEHLPFGKHIVDALVPLVVRNCHWLVEAANLAKLFEVLIHALIAYNRQRLVKWKIFVSVFLQYGPGIFVQLNFQGIGGLDGGYLYVVMEDVRTFQVGHI